MTLKIKQKNPLKKGNKPILKVSNIHFKYPDSESQILNGVDLKLYSNEIRIIVGASGCGKSTLVNAICGFIPNNIEGELSGSVLINGNNNRNRTIYEIARDISLVQQDPDAQLCTSDVYHEIAFALENFKIPRKQIKTKISEILKKLQLSQFKDRDLNTLSGGEKQKVAIASMLVLKPKVIILDEPTANLDPKTTESFIEFLNKLRFENDIGILIVDHDPYKYKDIADHILVLADGKIKHILSVHQFHTFNKKYYQAVFSHRPLDFVNSKGSDNLDTNHFDNRITTKNSRIKLNAKTRKNNNNNNNNKIIRINDLNFNYGSNAVLKNINFSIKRGEFIGLMGDNGSGKTTLIQNLLWLLPPNSGSIIYQFNGIKKHEQSTSELAKNIGYVFQNPNHMIFANTVWEEVMLAPKNFNQNLSFAGKNAISLLKLGDLNKYKQTHPILLSHGEKRRLNIASILSYQPDLIMLDEPFIGQDPNNISKILDYLLEKVSRGTSVLMITHRTEIVENYCTRLLFLKNGKLILDTSPKDGFNKLSNLGESSYLPMNLQNIGGES